MPLERAFIDVGAKTVLGFCVHFASENRRDMPRAVHKIVHKPVELTWGLVSIDRRVVQ